jgi:hypothetical protein
MSASAVCQVGQLPFIESNEPRGIPLKRPYWTIRERLLFPICESRLFCFFRTAPTSIETPLRFWAQAPRQVARLRHLQFFVCRLPRWVAFPSTESDSASFDSQVSLGKQSIAIESANDCVG